MIKFKRHIKVGDQIFETWFGLDIKKRGGKPNVSIYYYTNDPNEDLSVNQLIKSNFSSKDEAIRHGIRFVRKMYQEMIKRENNSPTKEGQQQAPD